MKKNKKQRNENFINENTHICQLTVDEAKKKKIDNML